MKREREEMGAKEMMGIKKEEDAEGKKREGTGRGRKWEVRAVPFVP